MSFPRGVLIVLFIGLVWSDEEVLERLCMSMR